MSENDDHMTHTTTTTTAIVGGVLTRTMAQGTVSFCVLCDALEGAHIGIMFWKGKPLTYGLCPKHKPSPSIALLVEAEVEKISPWPDYPAIPLNTDDN